MTNISAVGEYCPATNLRALAASVIKQAIKDLTSSEPIRALDALLFVADEERFGFWADALDLENVDVFRMLVTLSKHVIRGDKRRSSLHE